MTKTNMVSLAKEAIQAFGGVKATADALQVPITTVSAWQKSGIPAWRVISLRAAAESMDIKLPKGLAA